MRGGPDATHMTYMTRLAQPHVRLTPITYEVIILDDQDTKQRFTYETDCFPRDGKFDRGYKGEPDIIDFDGSYWVREIIPGTHYRGSWELLSPEEFREQFGPQGFEYGLQMPGRPRDVIEVGGDLVRANDELAKPENNGRTLVRRPFIEESDWEVVE